jgi:hypothetical protein
MIGIAITGLIIQLIIAKRYLNMNPFIQVCNLVEHGRNGQQTVGRTLTVSGVG